MCSIVLIHPSQFHLSICITAVIFNISEIVLWGRDVMRSDSSASASCLLGAHRPRRARKSKQAPEDTGSGRRCLLSPGKLWLVAKKKKGIFKLLCILGNLKKKKRVVFCTTKYLCSPDVSWRPPYPTRALQNQLQPLPTDSMIHESQSPSLGLLLMLGDLQSSGPRLSSKVLSSKVGLEMGSVDIPRQLVGNVDSSSN